METLTTLKPQEKKEKQMPKRGPSQAGWAKTKSFRGSSRLEKNIRNPVRQVSEDDDRYC